MEGSREHWVSGGQAPGGKLVGRPPLLEAPRIVEGQVEAPILLIALRLPLQVVEPGAPVDHAKLPEGLHLFAEVGIFEITDHIAFVEAPH